MRISATRLVKHPARSIPARELQGWTPIEVQSAGDQPRLEWANFGETPFSDPFFIWTVGSFKERESQETLITPLDALEAFQSAGDGLEPNGFIFHISHCGSTLVSNVLGGSPRNISMSEPAPVNEICSEVQASMEQRVKWLRGLIYAYGQRRLGVEENFFVKFNSYALGFFTLIRFAFPETPWICLYRHPVEIMAGQFQREILNTYWLLDEAFSGLDREQRVGASLVEVVARTLGRYYDAIREIAQADGSGLCINYSQLSRATYRQILEHFNTLVGEDEFEQMYSATEVHSKDLEQKTKFEGDAEKKRRGAYPAVHRMAEKWAMESYSRLEEIRLDDR